MEFCNLEQTHYIWFKFYPTYTYNQYTACSYKAYINLLLLKVKVVSGSSGLVDSLPIKSVFEQKRNRKIVLNRATVRDCSARNSILSGRISQSWPVTVYSGSCCWCHSNTFLWVLGIGQADGDAGTISSQGWFASFVFSLSSFCAGRASINILCWMAFFYIHNKQNICIFKYLWAPCGHKN